jgi:hypothetical protein
VFSNSREIPDFIDTFNDDIGPIGPPLPSQLDFPIDTYLPVYYRIFATDSLGRSGDTSEVCSLSLARQPELDTIDLARSTIRWESQFILGSVETYLKLWDAEGTVTYTCPKKMDYGSDNILYFTETFPDSLVPLAPGTWFYAIYLFAMGIERQSIKVGSFNVQE